MGELTEHAAAELLHGQRDFFGTGATLSYRYRKEQLQKLKNAVLRFEPELERALKEDLGKSRQESYLTEIGFVLSDISHTLRNLKKWMKPTRVRSPITVFSSKSRIEKQPYGIALIIGPFNYPFQLLIAPLTAAIAAGNCAVISPSAQTPHVSCAIRRLIEETFDRRYVCCTEGGTEANKVLLRCRFDTIFFTGSVNVGRIVMRAAAENLTPVTLELGGKSPVIVDETAKLDVACERIAWGKFMNAGQTCVAPDYVFVKREICAAFVERLKQTIRAFYGEEPQASADYGRIVNEKQMRRLCGILDEDKAFVAFGGEYSEKDRYIAPTLLCPDDISSAACMREELFGPLLPIFPYDSLKEALDYINGHEKPLALYIFSENTGVVEKILSQTSSGGVSVNDTISHIINPNLPFGGVGNSGMGRYHGEAGFLAFSNQRSVLNRSTRIRIELSYPPFSEKKLKTVRKLMK